MDENLIRELIEAIDSLRSAVTHLHGQTVSLDAMMSQLTQTLNVHSQALDSNTYALKDLESRLRDSR